MVPTQQEIMQERRRLESLPDAEIGNLIHGQVMNEPRRLAAIQIRDERYAKAQKQMHQDIEDRLSGIDGRLISVEAFAKKPETRSLGFWIAVIALIVAVFAAYSGWHPSHSEVAPPHNEVTAPSSPQTPKPAQ
jgi:hypothetical protein